MSGMDDEWPTVEADYIAAFGRVPPAMQMLHDAAPDFAAGYFHSKMAVVAEREGGLERKHKELIFSLIDVVLGHPNGAIGHAKAAKAEGLTKTELVDGLMQVALYCGVTTYALNIYPVLKAFEE